MRSRASVLYEDVLVARAMFAAAMERHRKYGRRRGISRSTKARLDIGHHRQLLTLANRRLAEAQADGSVLDRAGERIARSIARERIANDLQADRGRPCLCHACPA